MAGRVVVVGSINQDVVVRVERLPGPGETVSGGELSRHGGGKGANQAVAAARAGAEVELVGCVGDDPDGLRLLGELEAEGVATAAVARTTQAPTGTALIAVDHEGRNQIAVAPGANRLAGPLPPGLLDGAPGVILLSFEAPDALLGEAAQAAHARGWGVVCNPAPARALPEALVGAAPVLVPNEHEAAQLTGQADPSQGARALQTITGAPVIVTLGAAGALLVVDGAERRLPAPAVDAVDTTGAGDALCGTLAARLAAGDALPVALEAAVRCASEATTRPGAR